MNIGDVAARSGLPAKTIRYYEDIGLICPNRSANGYRCFEERDLHKLAFLGRARAPAFRLRTAACCWVSTRTTAVRART